MNYDNKNNQINVVSLYVNLLFPVVVKFSTTISQY